MDLFLIHSLLTSSRVIKIMIDPADISWNEKDLQTTLVKISIVGLVGSTYRVTHVLTKRPIALPEEMVVQLMKGMNRIFQSLV
jgi:hypothetical protein